MKSAVDIQCLPLGIAEKDELYKLVDIAIDIIEKSGLDYTVAAFSTTIEGELDEVWETALKAHKAVQNASGENVISYIKLATGTDLGSTEEKLARQNEGN
ncbi:MAG: thiamine-binding protein [Bacillota bacterium]